MQESLDAVACPECDAPAEVIDRMELDSTGGPVEHLKVQCVHRHWFLIPADRCIGWVAHHLRKAG